LLSSFSLSFIAKHPQTAALALEGLDAGDVAEVLAALEPEAAAPLLATLLPRRAADALACMRPAAAATFLDALEFGHVLRHLHPLEPAARQAIVHHLAPATRQSVVQALAFPPDSIGRAMDVQVVAVRPQQGVGDALAEFARRRGLLPVCYVVDEGGRPLGVASLGELVAAPTSASLIDIMRSCPPPISALARLASAREAVFADGDDFLAVVDGDQRLIGVLAKMRWARAVAEGGEVADAPELLSAWLGVADVMWQAGARMVGAGTAPAAERTVSGMEGSS